MVLLVSSSWEVEVVHLLLVLVLALRHALRRSSSSSSFDSSWLDAFDMERVVGICWSPDAAPGAEAVAAAAAVVSSSAIASIVSDEHGRRVSGRCLFWEMCFRFNFWGNLFSGCMFSGICFRDFAVPWVPSRGRALSPPTRARPCSGKKKGEGNPA